jgi:two-component system response regulator FixJ
MPELIHVVDDDDAVRASLKMLLELKGYAVRVHGSAKEFLERFSAPEALCVLADLRMPEMGALELQDYLHGRKIDVPFIVITGFGDVPSAVQAMKSGAADFIEKPLASAAVIAAIERARTARRVMSAKSQSRQDAERRIAALTPRERDVLRHLVAGSPNKAVAYALGISPRTVENHRARLMVKMRVGSLAELVRLAIEAGIAPPTGEAAVK